MGLLGSNLLSTVQGTSSASGLSPVSAHEVVIFNLDKDGFEVPLLTALEDVQRYFEAARGEEDQDYPLGFSFPRSFQYEMTFGQVTKANRRERESIFEGSQNAIFDSENNRVRIEREMRVFQEADTVVRIYDFDKMRVLVSDPIKKMCQ